MVHFQRSLCAVGVDDFYNDNLLNALRTIPTSIKLPWSQVNNNSVFNVCDLLDIVARVMVMCYQINYSASEAEFSFNSSSKNTIYIM